MVLNSASGHMPVLTAQDWNDSFKTTHGTLIVKLLFAFITPLHLRPPVSHLRTKVRKFLQRISCKEASAPILVLSLKEQAKRHAAFTAAQGRWNREWNPARFGLPYERPSYREFCRWMPIPEADYGSIDHRVRKQVKAGPPKFQFVGAAVNVHYFLKRHENQIFKSLMDSFPEYRSYRLGIQRKTVCNMVRDTLTHAIVMLILGKLKEAKQVERFLRLALEGNVAFGTINIPTRYLEVVHLPKPKTQLLVLVE